MIEPLPSEAELLTRCAKGDTGAFGKLVNHYENAVFNLVFRMVGNRHDAEDVTQEVFIRAFRKIRTFGGRSSFATWLYSIAANQSISERRRRSAKSRKGSVQMSVLDSNDNGTAYDPPGDGPAPDTKLQASETHRQIEQAIAELDDDFRTVVVLRDIEELDYSTISDVLGCSRGTVKSRLHRARLELRQKLQGLLTA